MYSDVPIQRGWAHKLRNLANCCCKANEEDVIAEARLIYLQETRPDTTKNGFLCSSKNGVVYRELNEVDDFLNSLPCLQNS